MNADANSRNETLEPGREDGAAENADIDQIQAEIEQTRQELGETVDALTSKLDVKTRARNQVDATRRRAMGQLEAAKSKATEIGARARDTTVNPDGDLKPAVPAGAVVLLLLGIGAYLVRRRRAR